MKSENHAGEVNHVERVTSVHEFVKTVCRIRDEWIVGPDYFDPWFRGQTKASWPLEPGIFRYGLLDSEDEIRSEFQRKGSQYMTEYPPQDYWGWYFLMQHSGAPTRLLDWTDSALLALFFALNSNSLIRSDDEDAVVWMLDPWWLNASVFDGDDAILLPSFPRAGKYLAKIYESIDDQSRTRISAADPAAIDPPFIARRVAIQRSHFTVFGHSRDGLTRLGRESKAHLTKILIGKTKLPRMRADLLTLGISDTSIYPELPGLATELTRYQLGTWPPD